MSLLSHSLSSSSDFFWLGHKKQFPSVTVCNWKVNCGKMKLTLSSLPFCVCFLTSFIFSPKSSPLFLLTTLLSTLLSPFQLTGSRQITNQASLQRRWSRLRSRSLLLGKADQEASHQRGQISLSSPRQTSSKSSTCLSVQPVNFPYTDTYMNVLLWRNTVLFRKEKCHLYILITGDLAIVVQK